MQNSKTFTDKLANGHLCLGTGIFSNDPTVVEAIAPDFDFLWIDTEHNAMDVDHVKCHLMAMNGTECASLVRVPWNDPVLIKPILDIGADGIIVPMVTTADDVAKAVAACKYPPEGIRGFGPLRPLNYGRLDALQYTNESNDNIVVVVQIESQEAANNIEEIMAVPGLTSIAFGPQDLSASMGYRTQPRHPEVLKVVETVVAKAEKANIPVGISVGSNVEELYSWIDMGIQWISYGVDVMLMIQAANDVSSKLRAHVAKSS